MFAQAGFFHFVELHDDPIAALDAEIRAAGGVTDSFIVLPEAFNLGRPYGTRPEEPCAFERDWLISKLQERSSEHRITFVTGMLDHAVARGERPSSSAYLIDGDDCRLICHKRTDDGTGHYAPFTGDCDIQNPMDSKGICIMAIICKDIEEHRCDLLTATTEASSAKQCFICIPAAMSSSAWLYNGNPGEHINFGLGPSKGKTRIILANSLPTGPCSFFTDTGYDVITLVPKGRRHCNRLMLTQV
jgi:hypothetical protein